MIDSEFRSWAESAFDGEPLMTIEPQRAIRQGRRLKRRRRNGRLASVATVAAAFGGIATVAAVPHSGGDTARPVTSAASTLSTPTFSTSQTTPTTPTWTAHPVPETATSMSPAMAARADSFRLLLTRALPAGVVSTHVFILGRLDTVQAALPDVPHRVSLALGDQGWVSVLTGATGLDRASACASTTNCHVDTRSDGSLVISRTYASAAALTHDNAVSVLFADGRWVSATASNAILDAAGTPGGASSQRPAPLSLQTLRVIALSAAESL